jgi:Protein of unknown function (DUF1579)
MKTKTLALSLGLVAAAGAALAQAPEAPKPGPEHKALQYFVGKWTSEGELKPGPLGPGGKMTSQDSCEWFAGGFHVVCRGTGKMPSGSVTSLGVVGYNTEDKAYTFYGVDSMGMGDLSKGQKSGKTWTFTSKASMNGQPFHSRYTMTEISPTAYTFKWETSSDGTKWTNLMEGKSTKAGT